MLSKRGQIILGVTISFIVFILGTIGAVIAVIGCDHSFNKNQQLNFWWRVQARICNVKLWSESYNRPTEDITKLEHMLVREAWENEWKQYLTKSNITGCGPNWNRIELVDGIHCYQFNNTATDRMDAVNICRMQNGTLPIPKSKNDNLRILETVPDKKKRPSILKPYQGTAYGIWLGIKLESGERRVLFEQL